MFAERASPEVDRSHRTPRWPTVARTTARTPTSATRSASVSARANSSDSRVVSDRPTRESRMRPAPSEVAKFSRNATSSGASGRSTPSASRTPRPGESVSGLYPSSANTPASDSGAMPTPTTRTDPVAPALVNRSRFGVRAASTGLRPPVAGCGRSPSPSRTMRATCTAATGAEFVGVSIIRRGRSAPPSRAAARRFKGFRPTSGRSHRPVGVRDPGDVRDLRLSLDPARDPGHPPGRPGRTDLARPEAAPNARRVRSRHPPARGSNRDRGDHPGHPVPGRPRRFAGPARYQRLAAPERVSKPVPRAGFDQLHLDRDALPTGTSPSRIPPRYGSCSTCRPVRALHRRATRTATQGTPSGRSIPPCRRT